MMFSELRQELHTLLDAVTTVIAEGDDTATISMARSEVPNLIESLRTLLAGHTPNPDGYCATCTRYRWGRPWGFRRTLAPCSAFLDARRALLGEDRRRHALVSPNA